MSTPAASPNQYPTLILKPRLRQIAAWLNRSGPLGFALVSLAAFAVRAIGLSHSFELWVDEMVYTELGNSVSHGQLPNLSGQPFFLHPPGAFLIDGLVIKIFGISGDSMTMVYDLRWLNAALGALTVGLTFVVIRRVATPGIAWTCAVILAFDPFVLRNNSRMFLETPAALFVIGGYLLVIVGLSRDDKRLTTPTLVASGLLFGYGVLTKDAFVMMTVLPLILAGFWRATLKWREVGIICGIAAVPYVAYIALVGTDSMFGRWISAKETGIERMVGLHQTTGFNAPNAPSLLSRIIDQTGQFGTSYLLLILCPVAGVVAALSRHQTRRLIGLVAVSMGGFGIYTALFGTFEEQYGYGVMIASVLAIGAAYADLLERRPDHELLFRALAGVLAVLTVGLGVRAEATADNGFQQARAWVQQQLPATAHVGVTNSTGQWAFANDPRFGVWPSASSMQQHGANYILTQSLPTSEGYGYAKPKMLEWLEAHAQAVFTFSGPTNGNTVLWYVNPGLLQQAASQEIGS